VNRDRPFPPMPKPEDFGITADDWSYYGSIATPEQTTKSMPIRMQERHGSGFAPAQKSDSHSGQLFLGPLFACSCPFPTSPLGMNATWLCPSVNWIGKSPLPRVAVSAEPVYPSGRATELVSLIPIWSTVMGTKANGGTSSAWLSRANRRQSRAARNCSAREPRY
jgi:hypothetical protein